MESSPDPHRFPSACPRSLDLDPLLAEIVRVQDRAQLVQLPYGPAAWLISGYADNRAIYSREEFMRQGIDTDEAPRLTAGLMLEGAIGCQDPETHRLLRQAANRALDDTAIAQVESVAEECARELATALQSLGDSGDLVANFARPYSLRVLCKLMDLPTEEDAGLSGFVADILAGGERGDGDKASVAGTELGVYLMRVVNDRRRDPGTDFVSRVLDQGTLSTYQIVVLVYAMVMGGFDSTAAMLSKIVARVLSSPGLASQIRAGSAPAGEVVDELLRLTSVAGGSGIPWLVNAEVELAGLRLRPGEYVIPAPGAANRDATIFEMPHEFRLGRKGRPHQTFGYGSHYCLGHRIAKLELETALRVLLEAFPSLRLDVEVEDLAWDEHSATWHLLALPLAWGDEEQ